MAFTFASASSREASKSLSWENCALASASNEISVTRKRLKWAVTLVSWDTMALVIGSTTEFDEGVMSPIRTRSAGEPNARARGE